MNIIPGNTEKTIIVEPGEYFENLELFRLNNVTLRSQSGPSSTIINGGGNDIVVQTINDVVNFTIDGFTLTGGAGGEALDFEPSIKRSNSEKLNCKRQ